MEIFAGFWLLSESRALMIQSSSFLLYLGMMVECESDQEVVEFGNVGNLVRTGVHRRK